jgi:hypothetical protein
VKSPSGKLRNPRGHSALEIRVIPQLIISDTRIRPAMTVRLGRIHPEIRKRIAPERRCAFRDPN